MARGFPPDAGSRRVSVGASDLFAASGVPSEASALISSRCSFANDCRSGCPDTFHAQLRTSNPGVFILKASTYSCIPTASANFARSDFGASDQSNDLKRGSDSPFRRDLALAGWEPIAAVFMMNDLPARVTLRRRSEATAGASVGDKHAASSFWPASVRICRCPLRSLATSGGETLHRRAISRSLHRDHFSLFKSKRTAFLLSSLLRGSPCEAFAPQAKRRASSWSPARQFQSHDARSRRGMDARRANGNRTPHLSDRRSSANPPRKRFFDSTGPLRCLPLVGSRKSRQAAGRPA
jgi:hypothetical protein